MNSKINFNVLYRVNTILFGKACVGYLYKDKKEYYMYLGFYRNIYVDNFTLFFKLTRYELINLLRKKTDLITIIEKRFDDDESVFNLKDGEESITENTLIPITYTECKKYFDIIGLIDDYNFAEYAYYLEKKLNNRLRKEKIKNLIENENQ